MKKITKIEFELINKQEIKIYGYDEDLVKHEIGYIFTPASSGANIINAIQICGFREAYDYWGCARYQFPKIGDNRERICNHLDGKKNPIVQAKDIQLLFDIETIKTKIKISNECWACFNNPCTCENKGNHAKLNPYNIKRETDVQTMEK